MSKSGPERRISRAFKKLKADRENAQRIKNKGRREPDHELLGTRTEATLNYIATIRDGQRRQRAVHGY